LEYLDLLRAVPSAILLVEQVKATIFPLETRVKAARRNLRQRLARVS
jgi:hypothetical protein